MHPHASGGMNERLKHACVLSVIRLFMGERRARARAGGGGGAEGQTWCVREGVPVLWLSIRALIARCSQALPLRCVRRSDAQRAPHSGYAAQGSSTTLMQPDSLRSNMS
jgi:hypothetical protein